MLAKPRLSQFCGVKSVATLGSKGILIVHKNRSPRFFILPFIVSEILLGILLRVRLDSALVALIVLGL